MNRQVFRSSSLLHTDWSCIPGVLSLPCSCSSDRKDLLDVLYNAVPVNVWRWTWCWKSSRLLPGKCNLHVDHNDLSLKIQTFLTQGESNPVHLQSQACLQYLFISHRICIRGWQKNRWTGTKCVHSSAGVRLRSCDLIFYNDFDRQRESSLENWVLNCLICYCQRTSAWSCGVLWTSTGIIEVEENVGQIRFRNILLTECRMARVRQNENSGFSGKKQWNRQYECWMTICMIQEGICNVLWQKILKQNRNPWRRTDVMKWCYRRYDEEKHIHVYAGWLMKKDQIEGKLGFYEEMVPEIWN